MPVRRITAKSSASERLSAPLKINFSYGFSFVKKGGVICEVDKKTSVPKRIKILERDDRISETGARHRSTEEYHAELQEKLVSENELLSQSIEGQQTVIREQCYPAILACWNSEEGQREFAAWQAEQAHHTTSKEKQGVPDGERPVVHIVIVCGLWQGASYSGAHPVFCFALNLLAHGFQPHSSNISPGHRSESNPHSPTDRCR